MLLAINSLILIDLIHNNANSDKQYTQ